VPDRPLVPPDLDAGEARLFSSGALTLRSADGAVTFWVPDTRYDDVTVTLALRPGPGGGDARVAAPVLVLGDAAYGGTASPWPAPGDAPPADGAPASVSLTRQGGRVTLASGGRQTSYAAPGGSTALGLRVGGEPVVVVGLSVDRR
jgi:hypothetical protein